MVLFPRLKIRAILRDLSILLIGTWLFFLVRLKLSKILQPLFRFVSSLAKKKKKKKKSIWLLISIPWHFPRKILGWRFHFKFFKWRLVLSTIHLIPDWLLKFCLSKKTMTFYLSKMEITSPMTSWPLGCIKRCLNVLALEMLRCYPNS